MDWWVGRLRLSVTWTARVRSCRKTAQCVCRAEGPVGQREEAWRMGCGETTVGHTGPEG